MSRNISPALGLIREFEGLRLDSYLCPAGIPTIGYGSTGPDIQMGMTWTHEQANERLADDVEKFAAGVEGLLKVPLTDNQFAALVSFAYNVGLGALAGSTLLRKLNADDYQGAADQFPRWNKGGGKVLPGLVRRRAAERDLFLSDA